MSVPLPSAPRVTLAPNVFLQPPLSRRGIGPGLVLFLPDISFSPGVTKPLDPEPILKWAEEGFAVVGIVNSEGLNVEKALTQGVKALSELSQVDIKDKFAVIVYEPTLIPIVSDVVSMDSRVVALVGYGSFPSSSCKTPALLHLASTSSKPRDKNVPTAGSITQYSYSTDSPNFVLPQSPSYTPGNASVAHSRTLSFLRKHLGGPFFDLEAIWDEHTLYEFGERSVEKTMSTMVAEPYVNDIPNMTGGIGRKALTDFYQNHFIHQNPADSTLEVVTRTVGSDRIIDEFVCHLTHDQTIDWLLPGVPPTGKKLSIPMISVVNVRGDRLYNEHIWWDQATVLRQAGILPTYVPFPLLDDSDAPPPLGEGHRQLLRLPVAGAECAAKLVNETKEKSNGMFGSKWGLQTHPRN
ncbi:hypothetical protein JR316_0001823 [Psilocybe cubensis]|uniref:Uncharacterized protein n=2 Tax=Psilocybe cubensis TaxID=181762 RepID=A0ACB8HAQ6_PSICU|nr:hypothetical protein JR316_0001823 [Psilocybe cubensis]KAH9484921.1 hypothetical protein JR316_0001823 [Psilocybe cubensis]